MSPARPPAARARGLRQLPSKPAGSRSCRTRSDLRHRGRGHPHCMLARALRTFAGHDRDAERRRERVARAGGIDHIGRRRGDAPPAHYASGHAKLDRGHGGETVHRDGHRVGLGSGRKQDVGLDSRQLRHHPHRPVVDQPCHRRQVDRHATPAEANHLHRCARCGRKGFAEQGVRGHVDQVHAHEPLGPQVVAAQPDARPALRRHGPLTAGPDENGDGPGGLGGSHRVHLHAAGLQLRHQPPARVVVADASDKARSLAKRGRPGTEVRSLTATADAYRRGRVVVGTKFTMRRDRDVEHEITDCGQQHLKRIVAAFSDGNLSRACSNLWLTRVGTRTPAGATTRASRKAATNRRLQGESKPAPAPLIKLSAVRKLFGKRVVIDKLHLTVAPGELVEVTGPSGAGKTTLLRLLHGQLRPTAGEVWVEGRALHKWWRRDLDRIRQDVSFLFQDQRLLGRLTALENVVVALMVNEPDTPYREIQQRAAGALDALGVGHRRDAYPHQLSAGERQRVAVARALVSRPRVLLADEPFTAIDRDNAQVVARMLEEAAAHGTAVVVATHRPSGRAARVLRLPDSAVTEGDDQLAPANGSRAAKLGWRRLVEANGHSNGHSPNGHSNGKAALNGHKNGSATAARPAVVPQWKQLGALLANSFRLVVLGGLRSWRRDLRFNAPAMQTLAMVLLLGGLLALVGISLGRAAATAQGQASTVRVYLAENATDGQISALREKFIAYAVTANSMRAVAAARREEVITLRLLGARHWMLRDPFVIEGLMTGAIAGLIAGALVAVAYLLALRFADVTFVQLLPGVGLTATRFVVAGVVIAGMVLGVATSILSFRRVRA